MSWSVFNNYIPIVGALICILLSALALGRDATPFRKGIFIGLLVISAISIALYWSDSPEVTANGKVVYVKPPFVAYLGLWGMKLQAMLAGVGLAMLRYLTSDGLRPLLYALILLSGLAGALMTAALFV